MIFVYRCLVQYFLTVLTALQQRQNKMGLLPPELYPSSQSPPTPIYASSDSTAVSLTTITEYNYYEDVLPMDVTSNVNVITTPSPFDFERFVFENRVWVFSILAVIICAFLAGVGLLIWRRIRVQHVTSGHSQLPSASTSATSSGSQVVYCRNGSNEAITMSPLPGIHKRELCGKHK